MRIDKRLNDLEKRTGITEDPIVYFADDPPTPTPAELEQVRAELAEWAEERFGDTRVLVISSSGATVFLPDNGRGPASVGDE